MSDATHTQGRFYAEPTPSSTFVTRAIYAAQPEGPDVLVAHVGIPGPAETRPSVFEDLANAALFAAAPEMLAALRALREQFITVRDYASGRDAPGRRDWAREQIALIDSVVAKAEGQR